MKHIPHRFDSDKITQTETYKSIQQWMQIASVSPGLWVLTGDPGHGKTWGAVSYALEHGISYLCALPGAFSSSKPGRVLLEIARAVFNEPPGRPADAYQALLNWADITPNACIIIDEAQRIPGSAMDILRDITDRSPCSMIWIGTEALLKKISYYPVIRHRVSGRFSVPALTLNDMRLITGWENGLCGTLCDITHGNYRHVSNIMEYAQQINELSPDALIDIAKNLVPK